MGRFKERYGGWALVTGASSGIGAALVDQLAKEQLNVVLVARGREALEAQAAAVKKAYGIDTRVVPADLTTAEGTQQVIDAVADLEVGVLVPCAAIETQGYFVQDALARQRALITMDVAGPMELVHHFGAKMAARRRGAILLVSSLSGWMAQPYMAHYGAAKAYVMSLGESLHHELKDHGVDVSVLSPGPTATPMAAATGIDFASLGMAMMQPAEVAACGLAALGKRAHAIPGVRNKLMAFMMTRLMPRQWAGTMFRMMMGKAMKIDRPVLSA